MKNTLMTFFLILILGACQKQNHPVISMPSQKYRLLSKNSEDVLAITKMYKKSKIEFQMDFDSGEFSGKYKELSFKGKFDILKVSSGLTKGFNYRIELAYLSKDASDSKAAETFFSNIANCNRIFISPDRLIDSQYVKAELFFGDDSQKMILHLLK